MKLAVIDLERTASLPSLSVRRAWIEIGNAERQGGEYLWSLSVRRAWIEIHTYGFHGMPLQSLSVRRAWIEIIHSQGQYTWTLSLSVRRAWIEIFDPETYTYSATGRSP